MEPLAAVLMTLLKEEAQWLVIYECSFEVACEESLSKDQ